MINGKTGFVKNLVFVESDSTLENAVRAESNIFVVATDLQETFSPFILKKKLSVTTQSTLTNTARSQTPR